MPVSVSTGKGERPPALLAARFDVEARHTRRASFRSGPCEACHMGGTTVRISGERHEVPTDLFGSPLTSLVTQRTSEHRPAAQKRADRRHAASEQRLDRFHQAWIATVRPALAVETAFRHRGWIGDRARVRAAMVRTRVPAYRLEKFDQCGAGCNVEASTDGTGVRVRASYCGDRWCVPCCTARSVRIVRNITRLAEGQPLYFETYTCRAVGDGLAECLAHTLASFKRLRASAAYRSAASGGCFTVEITRGRRGDHWHVHVHCLRSGRYISQRCLSDVWKLASRGSFIVDIQRAGDRDKNVKYVASYAAKGWSRSILNDEARCDESMIALRGRRLIATFGDWYDADVDADPVDARVFRHVGRLSDIHASALNGEAWAIGILSALGVQVSGAVRFCRVPSPLRPVCRDPGN